jgi:O-methyltransferase
MVAGIVALFNDGRDYFLYDSFEGFPPGKDIDVDPTGMTAPAWQSRQHLSGSKDNCRADVRFAEDAMRLSGAKHVHIHKGWFQETLPAYPGTPIAILRADADWYDSTMDIFNNLFRYVVPGGLIIIDDYYYWDGCAKAVHDFFSKHQLSDKIRQFKDSYAYIHKA